MVRTTLRVGGYAPRESTHGAALETFRREMSERTAGEVGVEILWNVMDEGRPATDLLSMVETGELFLCYFSTSYLCHRIPLLDVLETPFLFPGLPEAHRALDGPLGDALSEATRSRTGFEVLGYWDNGFRHLTNRLRPVRTPEDCRGMRVRLQPNSLHEEMVRSWGGVPVAVELSRGIAMLQAGEVDAQENPLANTVAYGVDRLHRHVTLTGHLYGARGVYANRIALEALPPEAGTAVYEAARAAILAQRVDAEAGERELRARLEDAGLAFVDLTPEERRQFVEASAPAVQLAHERLGEEIFRLAVPPGEEPVEEGV